MMRPTIATMMYGRVTARSIVTEPRGLLWL
jgi:hypothetical protein